MKQHNYGWIELICGPMFSGKTEELIRRLKRALIAKKNVVIFKPLTDDRYSNNKIVSHNNNSIESVNIDKIDDIIGLSKDAEVIGIDEIQFFNENIGDICNKLANSGKRVITAGLDKDYLAKPFGSISSLLVEAEYITKLNAICVHCGDKAFFTKRITEENNQIVVGESDKYEARCRACFNK